MVIEPSERAIQVSAVIATYRAERHIVKMMDRLLDVLRKQYPESFEIILVNDASPDRTLEVLESLLCRAPELRIVDLVKNVGQQRAILCGMAQARGSVVVTLDDDLQHPPEEIPRLVSELFAKNADVVIARYQSKRHGWLRRTGTFLVKWINSRALGIPATIDLTSFRAIRAEVAKLAVRERNPNPVVGFLLFGVAGRVVNVDVVHYPSARGVSTYTLWSLLRYFHCQLFDYSSLPLQFVAMMGAVTSLFSVVVGAFFLFRYLKYGSSVTGFTTLVILICLFSGLILLSLGVLGRYLFRIMRTLDMRRYYRIRRILTARR